MRFGASKVLTRALTLVVSMAGLLVVSSTAQAVSGAAFTTINSTADAGGTGAGEGLCHNGNGNVNCNQYFAKGFVWINGGPDKNQLTDGTYFFAVNVPGSQPDPNDKAPFTYPKPRTDGNLSDDYDPYTNRTFTVKNGEIFSYAGTHDQGIDVHDNNERKIRLFPYSDTTNNGGVYILSICQLADAQGKPVNGGYPVDPKECKYDAFKIMKDDTPPNCPPPTFAFNAAGMGIAQQVISDAGGIDSIEIKDIVNLNVTPLQPGVNWFQGTTMQVSLTATEIVRGAGSRIRIIVTDVGGNVSECDPVLATLKVRPNLAAGGRTTSRTYRVSQREGRVVIQNGRPGLSRVVAVVNGRKFVARNMRAGERRVLRIASALRPGHGNRVTIRGTGGRGGDASIMISN